MSYLQLMITGDADEKSVSKTIKGDCLVAIHFRIGRNVVTHGASHHMTSEGKP